VTVLRAHRRHQIECYRQAGLPWREYGYVFTRPDGRPYHPNSLTHRFQKLVAAAGLPPVRLHDLRHGAATLAHEAGADLKTVQDQLGHASIVTADTYTSVLPPAQHRAAEATARLVLAAAHATIHKIRKSARPRNGRHPWLRPHQQPPPGANQQVSPPGSAARR
jgi:integrase